MITIKQFAGLVLIGALVARSSASQEEGQENSFAQALEQSRPGPEHRQLGELSGGWDVTMRFASGGAGETTGSGRASTILDGRFLVIDFALGDDGSTGSYRYTIGFDRRHAEYSIIVMDTTGTYFVAARGAGGEQGMRMAGTDDDPQMARMGFEKKFLFELDIEDPDVFSVELFFVDTRTEEEKAIPYAKYSFERTD